MKLLVVLAMSVSLGAFACDGSGKSTKDVKGKKKTKTERALVTERFDNRF